MIETYRNKGTTGVEGEQEKFDSTIGGNFQTKLDLIFFDRTSAICINADMSFKTRLEADMKKEYHTVSSCAFL